MRDKNASKTMNHNQLRKTFTREGDEQFLSTNTALKKRLKGKLYSEEVNQEDTMNNLFITTK